jgi:hypothetical protein
MASILSGLGALIYILNKNRKSNKSQPASKPQLNPEAATTQNKSLFQKQRNQSRLKLSCKIVLIE